MIRIMKKHVFKIICALSIFFIVCICATKYSEIPLSFYIFYCLVVSSNYFIGRDDGRYTGATIVSQNNNPYNKPFHVKHADKIMLASLIVCSIYISSYIDVLASIKWILYLLMITVAGLLGTSEGLMENIDYISNLADDALNSLVEQEKKIWELLDKEAGENGVSNIMAKYIASKLNGMTEDNETSGRKNRYPFIYRIFEESQQIVVYIPDFNEVHIYPVCDETKLKEIVKKTLKETIAELKHNEINLPFASELYTINIQESEKIATIELS